MKKWTGGSVILALALLLFLRYTLLPSSVSSPLRLRPNPSPPPRPSASPLRRHPKPPLLSSLPGLDTLFPTPSNQTRPPDLTSPKLAWAHMRTLLSRSDALPGTADGVKEAAVAWKDLLDEIEPKKEPPLLEKSDLEKKSCPFSVSGNLTSLQIPCGLVQDSALTIVGVVGGGNGTSRFAVELAGSGIEPQPVVLQCNVSLGGDDPPVIAQSSWSAETGWGKWERCPAHGSAAVVDGNRKVDGLISCNQQLGESVIPENVNGTSVIEGEKKSGERSKRSAHLSASFPFVEGQPFTATWWVGVEGFHMTVNGRHETSFGYRERLEPWSVSEVRVEGDLEVMSFLVNGLPVSEDLDLVGDIERMKAPPIPKKRLFMLVGVFSTSNNFERRMALRRSWMQYESVRSGEVAVRFLTGLHKNMQVNLELWSEAQTYGDIQLMPFVDYYSLITLKTVAICILGTKVLPAKYIMKTDDDAFVRIDEVLSGLKKNVPHGLLYGLISFDSSPQRDKDSKWFISPEEWPHETYPPWAHGPGYVISRDIAKFIFRGHEKRDLQLFKLEDVAMGIWIQEFKRSGEEVSYVSDERFHNVGCESNYILAHYQGPRLLLCLWEKLQKEGEAICCD